MRKRKVKAWNHISCALVSFSCVYVRFAVPKTHPSWAYKFSALVLARAQCLWWNEIGMVHISQSTNIFTMVWYKKSTQTHSYIWHHCIGLFCGHSISEDWENACMCMCCASKYDMRIFFGTKTTNEEANGMWAFIFFSSLCSLKT